MDDFCHYSGLQASQVRFMLAGKRCMPGDTAAALGLERGGRIVVEKAPDEAPPPGQQDVEQTLGNARELQLAAKERLGAETMAEVDAQMPAVVRAEADEWAARAD